MAPNCKISVAARDTLSARHHVPRCVAARGSEQKLELETNSAMRSGRSELLLRMGVIRKIPEGVYSGFLRPVIPGHALP